MEPSLRDGTYFKSNGAYFKSNGAYLSGGGISEFPIILEKSSNLLGLRVYTVKNAKKIEKVFFEL